MLMPEILSPQGPDCHEAAVQWEGNFTRHAAQNPKAKTIEDTGVSESSELLVSVLSDNVNVLLKLKVSMWFIF